MPTFTDAAGRSWELRISLAAAERIEACDFSEVYQGPVSFLEPPPHLFEAILGKTALQFALIWCIIKPQADQQQLTQEQFCEGIDGTNLTQAKQALWEAVADFFPELRTSLSRLFEIQVQQTKRVDQRLSQMGGNIEAMTGREVDRALAELERKINEGAVRPGTTSTGSPPPLASPTGES